MTRRAFFVIGMHRSGTSVVAGALRFGRSQPGEASPLARDAADGVFDPAAAVMRLNDRLLQLAGGRWDKIPLWLQWEDFSRVDFAAWCAGFIGDAAGRVWDEAFAGSEDDVVCHDPRLALTLPMWSQLASSRGYAPQVLLVHRKPVAVMASLSRHHGLSFARAADLLADYWAEMLCRAPADARVIGWERFCADPVATLEGLGLAAGTPETLRKLVRPSAQTASLGVVPPPFMPEFLRECDALLSSAHGAAVPQEAISLAGRCLKERGDQKQLTGRTYLLAQARSVPTFNVITRRQRTVVLHCHIFKNAGSSVDELLKRNFGKRWTEVEFPGRGGFSNADLTHSFIRTFDQYDAVSTHTGDWWLGHDDAALSVRPIVFLRHPILRIRSAYAFERRQDADTLGARLAKQHDFSGYVKARLDIPGDLAFRNYQARRFAAFEDRTYTDVRSAAFRALERLPFVGLVEDFAGASQRMETYLKQDFPSFEAFEIRANATDASHASVADKLERALAELGAEVRERVLAENAVDLALYEAAGQKYPAS
ncbi:hypothetical protein ATO4_09157 [Aurantimonas sp. 22II-16-19i]|nr:hypothetical protein ATO4_09157 [Aurantimonas sp. 22II-16-19i]